EERFSDETNDLGAHNAIAVNEPRYRQSHNAVLRGDASIGIHEDGEGSAVVTRKPAHAVEVLFNVHAKDYQAPVPFAVIGFRELGKLTPTRRTPGGPEIEDHGLAAEITQPNDLAVDVLQSKVGRG